MLKINLYAAAALGLSVAASLPAHAITLEAGTVETSGTNSTIDLWYFTLDFDLLTGIQVDPISAGPPLSNENVSLILYQNDGLGSPGLQIAADGDALPGNARVQLDLTAGDYVVALSAYDLMPSEVGSPFQSDSTVPLEISYEIVLDQAGGNDSRFTCLIAGNLDGSFTQDGTNCTVPLVDVAEPASLGLLGIGLMTLMARRRVSSSAL